MRARSIASEAARDLASGTTRAALLALVFAAVAGTLAFVDVRAVVDVLRGAAEFRASGSSVHVLDAPQGIDGARCDALSSAAGVVAAGALRQGEPLRALAMPSSRLTVWEATPGVVDLLTDIGGGLDGGNPGGAGLWLSRDLAENLGARPGDTVATALGSATTAGVYTWPDDGRARTLGYAVVAPVAPSGVFDQCWVLLWPPGDDSAGLVYLALDPAEADDATVSRLNMSLGAEYDATTLLARRATVHAPVAAAVVGFALGHVGVRVRRLELAAALHARVRGPHLAWQHVLEATAWVVAGAAIAAVAVAYARGDTDAGGYALGVGARSLAAGAAAAMLGTLLGVATTRERHLFRYFKDR